MAQSSKHLYPHGFDRAGGQNPSRDDQVIEEIIEFQKQNSRIKIVPNKLCFNKTNLEVDIFKIGLMNFDWIISERLKDKLEEENVTGYEVKEIDWLVVE